MVNETLGHAAGDELLCHVSDRLKRLVRADDAVGRLGGDKFVVILNKLNRARDSGIVAEKIIQAFSGAFTIDDREIFMNPSIGITVFPEDAVTPVDLIRNADAAMYHAQELGRNRYQFYTAAMKQHTLERLDLESQLRRALERGEFVLHYQPKVDLKSREVVGFEALVRWQTPDIGLVLPGKFFPLLEETGLIVPVGEWALRAACDGLTGWKQRGYRCLPVSVNLSARQLQQASLPYHVIAMLAETGVNPRLLEFEITGSSLMRNPDEAVRLLKYFHEEGDQHFHRRLRHRLLEPGIPETPAGQRPED